MVEGVAHGGMGFADHMGDVRADRNPSAYPVSVIPGLCEYRVSLELVANGMIAFCVWLRPASA